MKALKVVLGLLFVAGAVGGVGWWYVTSERDKKHADLTAKAKRAEEKLDLEVAKKLYKQVETPDGKRAMKEINELEALKYQLDEHKLTTAEGLMQGKSWPDRPAAEKLDGILKTAKAEYARGMAAGKLHELALEDAAAMADYTSARDVHAEGEGAAALKRLDELRPAMEMIRKRKWKSALKALRELKVENIRFLFEYVVKGGTRLAMRTIVGKTGSLRTIAVGGGKATEFELPHKVVFDPDWSPDCRRLIYCATNGEKENGLYQLDVAGSRHSRIAQLPIPGDAVSYHRSSFGFVFSGGYLQAKGVIFTDDDATRADGIALEGTPRNVSTSNEDTTVAIQLFIGTDSEIWVIHKSGSRTMVSKKGAWSEMPAFRPDGKRVAFSMVQERGNFDLFVANPDGSNLERLTTGKEKDTCPAWSPDGGWLAYVTGPDGKRVVKVRDLETKAEWIVCDVAGEIDPRPAWSQPFPDE